MRSLMVIFLLFCYACVTSGKEKVIFSSKNFINVLTWDPAEPRVPGEKVRYSVLYHSETEDNVFLEKDECQNITELFCDLTAETPAVYDVLYRAQVRADGRVHGWTNMFKPIAKTVLGAPILSISTTTMSIHVNVTLPLGPNNESISDIFRRIKKGPSSAITVYSLHITQPLWAAQEIENTTGHFIVNLKNDQTEYCGYVVYKPAFEWGRPSSENASFCVTLSDNPWMVLPWSLMSVAVLAAVVLMAVCGAKHYVKDVKTRLPKPLVIPHYESKVLQYPDENKNISKVVISTVSEKTMYAKIQVKPNVPSPLDGGYGHKNTVLVPWQDESSLDTMEVRSPVVHYQDDSSQSSDIYGAVAIHVEENEDFYQLQTVQADRNNTLSMCHGEGLGESGPIKDSCKTIPLSNLDIYENNEAQPLLLQTQRDSNGQLVLPMLSFQVQTTLSGTTEALTSPERKPLLKYLMVSSDKGPPFVSLHSLDSSGCSDSGTDENTVPSPTDEYCNSHYLRTHQYQQDFPHFSAGFQSSLSCDSGTYDSPYRQNWMSSIIGGSSTHNCKK